MKTNSRLRSWRCSLRSATGLALAFTVACEAAFVWAGLQVWQADLRAYDVTPALTAPSVPTTPGMPWNAMLQP